MNEFLIGQKCIRSVRAADGRYVVSDSTGAFFPAHHNRLTAAGIKVEFEDNAPSFQNVCSRAAFGKKGKVNG